MQIKPRSKKSPTDQQLPPMFMELRTPADVRAAIDDAKRDPAVRERMAMMVATADRKCLEHFVASLVYETALNEAKAEGGYPATARDARNLRRGERALAESAARPSPDWWLELMALSVAALRRLVGKAAS